MSAAAFTASFRLLRTRRFGTFWFASLLSNIGTWAQQVVQPWMVIGLSLLVGITDGLSMPSFQSIVPSIVPSIVEKQQIPTGLALNATQFNLSRIVGPAVAGVLMGSVGAAGAFGVSALSYVPFILVALWVLPHGMAAEGAVPGFAWASLRANVCTVLAQDRKSVV